MSKSRKSNSEAHPSATRGLFTAQRRAADDAVVMRTRAALDSFKAEEVVQKRMVDGR